jgi:RNA processing factor Prp31
MTNKKQVSSIQNQVSSSELKEMAKNQTAGVIQTIKAIPDFDKDLNLLYAIREAQNLQTWLNK